MTWPHIPFAQPIVQGRLIRRYKRFFADAELADGSVVTAHCATTGSMSGLLTPGAPVLLWRHDIATRKLPYAWQAVQADGVWVGIDTQLPNRLVAEALAAGAVPGFEQTTTVHRERKMGSRSRVDAVAEGPWGEAWIEVKNVTLVTSGVALFPDAITARGRKHLGELVERVREGHRAAMVYVIQRSDGLGFSPADEIDPEYGRALREAMAAGVEAIALRCEVAADGVRVLGEVPVRLP